MVESKRHEGAPLSSKLTTQEQIRSIWHLGGLSVRELALRVWNGILQDNLLGRASELAYSFILAIFPLFIFFIAIFGLSASRGTQLRENLMLYLGRVLPPSAYQVVSHTITEISRSSGGGKLTFGILLALWFASGGTAAMMSTLNDAYRVREGRSLIRARLTAIVLTIALACLVISALCVVLLGNYVAGEIGSRLHLGHLVVGAWTIGQWVLAVLFVIISFSLIYFYGPDLKEQHWYWITPGSVFGVLLWLAASFAFRYYLHFFNNYNRTYGSLGAVIILLIWFYVTGLAFLVGGEINAQIEHAAAERGHPEAKPKGQKAA